MKWIAGFTVMIAVAVAPVVQSAVIYVNDGNTGYEDGSQLYPWNTIQEGLDAALPGDEVRVAEGAYQENPDLQCEVSLKGGYDDGTWNRDPRFNLSIVRGRITGNGLGRARGTIDGFTIEGSIWMGNDDDYDPKTLTISNNRITSSSNADCIYLLETMELDLEISYNTLSKGNHGIQVAYGFGETWVIQKNLINDNRSNGIYFLQFNIMDLTIQNNTIVGNAGDGVSMIDLKKSRSAKLPYFDHILNNIITSNSGVGIYVNGPGVYVDYNDVWNNGQNYWGTTPRSNDFSKNPLFVNPARGNYHLFPGKGRFARSPCIDTATDVGLTYYGPAPDRGAFEYTPYFDPFTNKK